MKRNPFKKTPQSGEKSIKNAFKHLTERALGFDSDEASNADADAASSSKDTADAGDSSNGKENLNTENTAAKTAVINLESIPHVQNNSIHRFYFIFRLQK